MSSSSSPFRPDCLQGKVALVTGGGSGIGYEITRQLLLHGCRGVVICGRRAAFLKRSCDLLSQQEQQQQQRQAVVLYQVCDVRKPEDCQAAVNFCQSNFQRLDILVNGAAGNFLARASELSPKGFATVMAIDALGTFNMCRAAYSLLKQSSSSSDTCTASTSTSIVVNISATLQSPATWWQAHASAAKSAVDSLTRSLALEWGSHGIRVVGIAPGPIANTPGTTKLAPTTSSSNGKKTKGGNDVDSSLAKMIERGIPLKRMGEAWEIGQAVVYLATADYVTGDTLIVDGGEYLYRPPMVPETMVAQLSRQVEAKSRAQAPTITSTTTSMQSKL